MQEYREINLANGITLRGGKHSNDLAGKQYSVGREILLLSVDNLLGDTLVVLEVLIDFAGGKRTSSRMTFPWLLAEDNPVISC